MPRSYLPECLCGSGEEAYPEHDARGIFISYCCDQCRLNILSRYRPEVLTDSSYECDEDIEPDLGMF